MLKENLQKHFSESDSLFEIMANDCKNINAKYDLMDVIGKHHGNFSRHVLLDWFYSLWEFIPINYLYDNYILFLTEIRNIKGQDWYEDFFTPEILSKIFKVNKKDTIENPALKFLLDDEGFLTIYQGYCDKRKHNKNSWVLDEQDAIMLGRFYSFISNTIDFCCVTAKIKLQDVIAFIHNEKEHEILALPENTILKKKNIYMSKDIPMQQLLVLKPFKSIDL